MIVLLPSFRGEVHTVHTFGNNIITKTDAFGGSHCGQEAQRVLASLQKSRTRSSLRSCGHCTAVEFEEWFGGTIVQELILENLHFSARRNKHSLNLQRTIKRYSHQNNGLPQPQNMKGCLRQTHVQPSTRAMKWQQPSLWHKREYLPSATAKIAQHASEGEVFPHETLHWPKMTWFRQTSALLTSSFCAMCVRGVFPLFV